jgi:hypothetical protein
MSFCELAGVKMIDGEDNNYKNFDFLFHHITEVSI